jgi:hypothetical protein
MRSALLAAALVLATAPPAAAAPTGPSPKLLSAGKGPRKPLRYAYQTGTTDRAVMTMAMSMTNQVPGQPAMNIVIPTVETDLTINIGDPKADEHLFTFSLDDLRLVERPGVMDGVMPVMQSLLEKMKGMTGSGFINARGVTRDSSFTMPPGLPAEVRTMLEQTEETVDQMSTPLPKEAIGPGARWQLTMVTDRGGIKLTQTMTYKVVAIRGDQIELTVAITQTARPQLVNGPTGSYELASYKGTGSGTIVIDLRHPVPQSKVTMKVVQLSNVDIGGSKQKMPTTVTVDMTMARKN